MGPVRCGKKSEMVPRWGRTCDALFYYILKLAEARIMISVRQPNDYLNDLINAQRRGTRANHRVRPHSRPSLGAAHCPEAKLLAPL
jgi:hypothetical protein